MICPLMLVSRKVVTFNVNPGSTVVKNLPALQETQVQSLVGKISWSRKWQPTPVFLPRESHGQRSLAEQSSWGLKELAKTECACTTSVVPINQPLAVSESQSSYL